MTLERRLWWVVLYALAMAALEASVVVYLREIFCPGGALFPVLDFAADARTMRIGLVELAREMATVVMLAGVAVLAGATAWQRWAFFMLAFGLWDILYYAALWVFLRWPTSPMTWDILFLIPVTWTGPVLAPCLVSACLIGAAAAILAWEGRGVTQAFRGVDWVLEVVAGLTVILAFCANSRRCTRVTESEMAFPWTVFATGLALGAATFAGAVRRGLARN